MHAQYVTKGRFIGMKKKIICLVLSLCVLCTAFVACGEETGDAHMLSFSQAQSLAEMKKLDGKTVSIIGYMSTLSPVSGKFMYLMNLPYQSCPFCIPNTTQLSNTMAVYAKSKDGFEFTDRAIKVTGKLEFGDYTDEFGYEYSYRIVDATYSVLDTSDMSAELALWQQLASTDAVAEIYTMFEYVNFTCFWGTYTAEFQSGKDYLHPADALYFIETDGAQFNYGFKEGYFDGIIATVRSVDETAFEDLIKIIEDAKALSEKAYAELKNGDYTAADEYSGVFGDGRKQYKMNSDDEFETEMNSVYGAFSEWLASWEL